MAADFKRKKDQLSKRSNMTLSQGIDKYIEINQATLSPSTIAGYKKIKKYRFSELMDVPMKKIDSDVLQAAINSEAICPLSNNPDKTVSPKTIKNAVGLIVSVINAFAPGTLSKKVKPPKEKPVFKELLSPDAIIKVITGTSIELPALLAMWLSFSESEIRGLTKSKSIDGDYITIKEVIVDGENGPVKKTLAKNKYRNRRHKIPTHIKHLIDQSDPNEDYLVTLSGGAMYKRFSRLLERNGLPHMSFHDLRHVSASVMAQLRIPDKYAMERGGWSTDQVMKNVYQHTFSDGRIAADAAIDDYFENLLGDGEKQECNTKYNIK